MGVLDPKPFSYAMKESQIQENVIAWFRLQYPKLCWTFVNEKNKTQKCQWLKASMNGANLNAGGVQSAISIRSSFKKQGILIGEADLELPIANKEYNGLFIELKTEKGRQNKSQKAFESQVPQINWQYSLCRSFEEAKATITEYLRTADY